MRIRLTLCLSVLGVMCLIVASAGAQEATPQMFGYDVQHTGVSTLDFQFPPRLQWEYTAANEQDAQLPVAAPAIGPDAVYVPIGTNLYALDRTTGAEKWKQPLNLGANIYSTPLYYNGTVFVGVDNNQLVAVSAEDGSRLWAFRTNGAVRSAPLYMDGVLYFGCDDGRIYALDLKTRTLRWYFDAGGHVRCSPAYDRGTIFAASDTGYLYALNAKRGTQVWNSPLGTTEVFSSPVVERGKVLIGAGDHLVACDTDDGAATWSFGAFGLITGSPAVKDRLVYVGTEDGSLYCLDAGNGRAVWRYPSQGTLDPIESAPVIHGNTLVFRSGARLVVALDINPNTPDDKRLVWQYTLPAPPATTTNRRGRRRGPGDRGEPPWMNRRGMRGGPGGPGMPGERGRGRYQTEVQVNWEDNCKPAFVMGDNVAYLLGDDHVVYGFNCQASDNAGPEISSALLDVQGKDDYEARYQVVVDRGDTFPGRYADMVKVPGAPPLTLSMELTDPGSGVDPATIQVQLDKQPVDTIYDPKQGLLWYVYNPQGAAVSLHNGVHNLTISAADWQGNKTVRQLSFTVDNSLPQPSGPERSWRGGRGGGGRGGRPGRFHRGPGMPPPPPPQ